MENHIHQAASALADDKLGKVLTAGVATIITLVFSWKFIVGKRLKRNSLSDNLLEAAEKVDENDYAGVARWQKHVDWNVQGDSCLKLFEDERDSNYCSDDEKYSGITSGYSSTSKLSPSEEFASGIVSETTTVCGDKTQESEMNSQIAANDTNIEDKNFYIDKIDGNDVIINGIEETILLPFPYEPTFSDSECGADDDDIGRSLGVIVEESVSDEDASNHWSENTSSLEQKETLVRQEKLKTFRHNFVQFGEYYSRNDPPFPCIVEEDDDDDVFCEDFRHFSLDVNKNDSKFDCTQDRNLDDNFPRNDHTNVSNSIHVPHESEIDCHSKANNGKELTWCQRPILTQCSCHGNRECCMRQNYGFSNSSEQLQSIAYPKDTTTPVPTDTGAICSYDDAEVNGMQMQSHPDFPALDSYYKTCQNQKDKNSCEIKIDLSNPCCKEHERKYLTTDQCELDSITEIVTGDPKRDLVGDLKVDSSGSSGFIKKRGNDVESTTTENEVTVENKYNPTHDNVHDNAARSLKTTPAQTSRRDNINEDSPHPVNDITSFCSEREVSKLNWILHRNFVNGSLNNGKAETAEVGTDQSVEDRQVGSEVSDKETKAPRGSESLSSEDSFDMDFQPPVFRRIGGFPRTISGDIPELAASYDGGFQRLGTIPRTASGPVEEIKRSCYARDETAVKQIPGKGMTFAATTFALVGHEKKRDFQTAAPAEQRIAAGKEMEDKARDCTLAPPGDKTKTKTKTNTRGEEASAPVKDKKRSSLSKLFALFGKGESKAKQKLASERSFTQSINETTANPPVLNNHQPANANPSQNNHRQLHRLARSNDLRQDHDRFLLMANGHRSQTRASSNDNISNRNVSTKIPYNNHEVMCPPLVDAFPSQNSKRDARTRQQIHNQTSGVLNKYYDTKLDSITGSSDTRRSLDPRSARNIENTQVVLEDLAVNQSENTAPSVVPREPSWEKLNKAHSLNKNEKLEACDSDFKCNYVDNKLGCQVYHEPINSRVEGATSQSSTSSTSLDDGLRETSREHLRSWPQQSLSDGCAFKEARQRHGQVVKNSYGLLKGRSISEGRVNVEEPKQALAQRPGHFRRFASGGTLSSNRNPEWFAATLGDLGHLTRRPYHSVLLGRHSDSQRLSRQTRSVEFEPNRSFRDDRNWQKRNTFLLPQLSKNSKSLVELLEEKEQLFRSRTFKSPLRGSYRLGFPASWLKSTEEILRRESSPKRKPLTKLPIYSARPKVPEAREFSFTPHETKADDNTTRAWTGSFRSVVVTDVDSGEETRLIIRETDVDTLREESVHPNYGNISEGLPVRAHSMLELECQEGESHSPAIADVSNKNRGNTLPTNSSSKCGYATVRTYSDKKVNRIDNHVASRDDTGVDKKGILSGRNYSDIKSKDCNLNKNNNSSPHSWFFGRLRKSNSGDKTNNVGSSENRRNSSRGSNAKDKPNKKDTKKQKKDKPKANKRANIGDRVAGLGRRRQNTEDSRSSASSTTSETSPSSADSLANQQRLREQRNKYRCPVNDYRIMIPNNVTMATDQLNTIERDGGHVDLSDVGLDTTLTKRKLDFLDVQHATDGNGNARSFRLVKQPFHNTTINNNVVKSTYISAEGEYVLDGTFSNQSRDHLKNELRSTKANVNSASTQYPEINVMSAQTQTEDNICMPCDSSCTIKPSNPGKIRQVLYQSDSLEDLLNFIDSPSSGAVPHALENIQRLDPKYTKLEKNVNHQNEGSLKTVIESLNNERSTWYKSQPSMMSSPYGSNRSVDSENLPKAEYEAEPKNEKSFPVLAHSGSVNTSRHSTPKLKRKKEISSDIQIAFTDTSLERPSMEEKTEEPSGDVTIEAVYDALLAMPADLQKDSCDGLTESKLGLTYENSGTSTPRVEYYETDLDDDSTCSPCSDRSSGHVTSDMSSLNSSIEMSPDVSSSIESLSDTYVRCRYPLCKKRELLSDARTHFKTCHNCVTYYCSRECRQNHWEKHKKRCMIGRVNSACKHVIKMVSVDDVMLSEFSKTARLGYLTQGRGYVQLEFTTPENAESFLRSPEASATASEWCDIVYVPIKEIDSLASSDKRFDEISEFVKSYNPEYKFVLSVTIATPNGWPVRPVPLKTLPFIHKCAKVKLSEPKVNPRCDGSEKTDTLILTAVPGTPDGKIFEGPKAREVFFINVQRNLREKGVSLRHQYPSEYAKLCAYVERDQMFAPILLTPRDGKTGKRFMCLIMPKSDPENEWLNDPNLLKELGLL